MAELGSAQSKAFLIGPFEVRIGPMGGTLVSVGLVDSYSWAANFDYTDIKEGLPRTLVDRVMLETTVDISFTTREFSSRNISLAMGGDGTSSSVGGSLDVNFLTVEVASTTRDGKTVTVTFPKCVINSGMKISQDVVEFSSQEWSVTSLTPSASDSVTPKVNARWTIA